MIKMGKKYKDSVSGFEGIAMARTKFLHGDPEVALEPALLKDGKPMGFFWFKESRLAPNIEERIGFKMEQQEKQNETAEKNASY